MKKVINSFAILLLSIVLFTGCSKDETADIREQMIGSYAYTMKMYEMTTMVEIGTDNGNFTVANRAGDDDAIDFKEGTEVFYGNKLKAASNGVVFDIPSQTFKIDGTEYQVAGTNYIVLGTTKYNGAYFSATKKISTAFTVSMTVDGSQVTVLVVFEGTKQ